MTGVPTAITDLNATAASNSPAGTDSIGTTLDDYIRALSSFVRQMYDVGVLWGGAASGTNTITLTASPAPTAYKTGQGIAWISAGTNTGAVTVNENSIGAKNLYFNNAALTGGELPAAGGLALAYYDGTQLQLACTVAPNPFYDASALIKNASDATKKLILSAASISTGTTRTLTAPDANTTIVGTDANQTLTNKKLTDANCTFADDGDATKQLAFQCSGITTSTTRTLTVPDASGTILLAYTPLTNSLSGDVTMTTQNTYYDGPSVAQGSTGTWFASGTISVLPPGSGQQLYAKLWDGTTVIASLAFFTSSNSPYSVSLSGYLASPAGNLRISVTNASASGGSIKFNSSGNSKDSTISAFRIA